MGWTEHDRLFGWVHSIRVNKNNLILRPIYHTEAPYPYILIAPTIGQVVSNWNIADTGLAFTIAIVGLLLSRYKAAIKIDSYMHERSEYKRMTWYFYAMAIGMGLRNSSNRLEGLVPNGLPPKVVEDPLKYDYTS